MPRTFDVGARPEAAFTILSSAAVRTTSASVETVPTRVASAAMSPGERNAILAVNHSVPWSVASATASWWCRSCTGLASTPLVATTSSGTPRSRPRTIWSRDWSRKLLSALFSAFVRLSWPSRRFWLSVIVLSSPCLITVDPTTMPTPRARKTATNETT